MTGKARQGKGSGVTSTLSIETVLQVWRVAWMQEKFFARFGTINSLNTLANTCTEASRMRLFLQACATVSRRVKYHSMLIYLSFTIKSQVKAWSTDKLELKILLQLQHNNTTFNMG